MNILIIFNTLLIIVLLIKDFFTTIKPKEITSVDNTSVITSHVVSNTARISNELKSIPDDVLKAITGLNNTHKGKLGELIGYLTLKAEYDRVLPLGTIIDFMAIKFGNDKEEGYIDFLDIKTGENARLNKEQRLLRDLIKNKQIRFRTIKVDSISGFSDDELSSNKQS